MRKGRREEQWVEGQKRKEWGMVEKRNQKKKKKTGKGIPTDSRRCVGKGGERKTGRCQSSWAAFDVRRQSLRAAFDL